MKKYGQSAVSQFLSVGSLLNPSVSVCWLTAASVAIALPFFPTACMIGTAGSSTYGYDDQHCLKLGGSWASA